MIITIEKPYAHKTMLLDIIHPKGRTDVLVLPPLDFSTHVIGKKHILKIDKPKVNCPKFKGTKKLRGVVFTLTDDPASSFAGHSIGLGYWNYRLSMEYPIYFMTKTQLIFEADNTNVKHMRPDR